MSPPFPQRQVFILLTDEALAQEGAREMTHGDRPPVRLIHPEK